MSAISKFFCQRYAMPHVRSSNYPTQPTGYKTYNTMHGTYNTMHVYVAYPLSGMFSPFFCVSSSMSVEGGLLLLLPARMGRQQNQQHPPVRPHDNMASC